MLRELLRRLNERVGYSKPAEGPTDPQTFITAIHPQEVIQNSQGYTLFDRDQINPRDDKYLVLLPDREQFLKTKIEEYNLRLQGVGKRPTNLPKQYHRTWFELYVAKTLYERKAVRVDELTANLKKYLEQKFHGQGPIGWEQELFFAVRIIRRYATLEENDNQDILSPSDRQTKRD